MKIWSYSLGNPVETLEMVVLLSLLVKHIKIIKKDKTSPDDSSSSPEMNITHVLGEHFLSNAKYIHLTYKNITYEFWFKKLDGKFLSKH